MQVSQTSPCGFCGGPGATAGAGPDPVGLDRQLINQRFGDPKHGGWVQCSNGFTTATPASMKWR